MPDSVRVNLGLQGGGAHGAFTWGVLDRLLEEDWIDIASISGTSAGALNAAALKSGWIVNERAGARENLDWLWGQIGALDTDALPPWITAWLPEPAMISRAVEYAPFYMFGEMVSRMTSPYSWGPLYANPLDGIVKQFDFDNVCAVGGPELFIGATSVREGKIRVFKGKQITTNAILASACLPTLFQAVDVADPLTGVTEAFWDGGYTGNPALFPMYADHLPRDIIVVNINPLRRDAVPVTPAEIQNRINEISFNSSLLRELRAIDYVQRLIDEGALAEGTKKNPRIHMIADDSLMTQLSVATKTVPIPSLLAELKDEGRRAAGRFLHDHTGDLGVRQTVDLRAMFA